MFTVFCLFVCLFIYFSFIRRNISCENILCNVGMNNPVSLSMFIYTLFKLHIKLLSKKKAQLEGTGET